MTELIDSVVQFHKRYTMFSMAIYLLFMLVFFSLVRNQALLQVAHEQRTLVGGFNETVFHLDSQLASVITRVEGLKTTAEADLEEQGQSGAAVVARAFASLAPASTPDLYTLDTPQPPLVRERIGNLTGLGNPMGRGEDFAREINMALRLNPQFKAAATSLKNIAWVYYTSKEEFLNIYPWVASSGFRFSPDLYKHGFYTQGLPASNPQRKPFWTEVYVDEYGKGLMTTCAAPVYDGDRFTGTVAIDLTVDFLNTVAAGFHPDQGTMFVVNEREQLVAHPRLITSGDKQAKTLGEAMPWLDGPSRAELEALACEGRAEMQDVTVLKGCLANAPWHVYYTTPKETLWQAAARHLGLAQLAMLLAMLFAMPLLLALMLGITNIYFIKPSQQFARFIMARNRDESARFDAKVPRPWRPWFETVAKTFDENDALAAEVQRRKDELEIRVQRRTEELASANQQLEREIGEREQVELSLRQSEERYRRIFDSIIDAYFELDLDGRILEASPSIETLLLYQREELVGQSLFDLHPDPETINHLLREVMERGRLSDFEILMRASDNTTVACSLNLMVVGEGRGDEARIIGSMRDNRDRNRAELEKKQLETRLQRAEKMEALGAMAGGVAHDLNNILSGIVGYPDLLLMQLDESNPLRNPILNIKKSGEKAAAIVRDMLALARRGVTVHETVNLNQIIDEYLNSPEFLVLRETHPSIAFTRSLREGLMPITGSAAHLSKTIMNLVCNAVEAIPGAGTVVISTDNQYVDAPIRGYDKVEEGDYVVVRVIDDGQGIPAEDLDKIFEPFYSKKKLGRKSGTGLGMAVVWGTVKDHSGYIDVHSAPGQGTEITLYFQAVRDSVVEFREEGASLSSFQGNETILVVDDVKEQRNLAEMLLSHLGYAVTTVASGEAAVAWLQSRTVDLVVLDMIMDPGIDGLDTYRLIAKLHPGQKAIITSGFSETDRVHEAQRLGAGAYVHKPYHLHTLGQAVRAELDRRVA